MEGWESWGRGDGTELSGHPASAGEILVGGFSLG